MSFLTSRESVAPQGIGKSMPRREDARLLAGAGQYAGDFSLPGQTYAYLVRSPHPHAKIIKTDVAQAIGGPGVIAVLTRSDVAADGVKPIPHSPVPTNPHEVPLRNRDGSGFFIAPHPVLVHQIATEAQRWSGVMQCKPSPPQLLCRSVDHPGNLAIKLGSLRLLKILSAVV